MPVAEYTLEPYHAIVSHETIASPFPETDATPYPVRATIDWQRHPALVIESDDWGACESARHAADASALRRKLEPLGFPIDRLHNTLESPADLDALYNVLASVTGRDGQPAVMTGFVCLGNPDYDAIRAADFRAYHDIGLDEGVPIGWERGDIVGAMRRGMHRGVFVPEFHAGLHHTSPTLWLELLRCGSVEGRIARILFDHGCYAQPAHLPEYHRMSARQQRDWVQRALDRFRRAFGVSPAAAVTSDATPVTEVVWSLAGMEVFCLKNARLHDGSVVIYDTKPWNAQDARCPMGGSNPELEMVYLSRNVHADGAAFRNAPDEAAPLVAAIHACWRRDEPAVMNTHRNNYVSLDAQRAQAGRRMLGDVLERLVTEAPNVCFLTTHELAQLYRQGYSVRRVGEECVVRQWSPEPLTIRLPGPVHHVQALPDQRHLPDQHVRHDGDAAMLTLPEGDYRVQ
ncbi:MAG: hypothetical protein ACODAQ_01475 [Phycisphaeraceae bacterium]